MDELIQQLTDRLGIDPSTAQGVAGKAMEIIKANVDESTFKSLASAIPGLDSIIMASATHDSGESGGGLLGKLAGMASGMLGGSAGNALEMGAALTEKGLPTDKLGEFVTMLIGFIKSKAGDDVLDQVFAKFPMLKSLVDGQG
ncbi:hypothetical protein Poly24_12320 [Rosistilla carotiformis]|uniref:DUF2267 domain-containing protein n=1 Tax=Rosistilla carotiformis TaxID=2528017 RepID=A0A518JPQ8_9BACT|nr:DUF2780 domain-containing protein [Rosistilla carotiformis]QDV67532.1 hypothetical protein Poly24_12320 [Rosistilla carotiformis]